MRRRAFYSLFLVFAFLLGAGANFALFQYFITAENKTIVKTVTETKIEETAAETAVKKVYDAVLVVETYKSGRAIGSGTGFIYKVSGEYAYIITNNHVVDGGDAIKITLTSGKTVDATVMGKDEYGDIAVLRIAKVDNMVVASVGSTSSVSLGSTVFAIGSPISSEYSGTTTRGVISGKDRYLPISLTNSTSNDWIMRVIQTDAAINPGNSGGPLINMKGEVIGVTSLKLVDSEIEGIGFAIPMEDVMEYVNKLEKGETIPRPVLGVTLVDVSEVRSSFYYYRIQIDPSVQSGVVIEEVLKGSSAEKAGLLSTDVITKVGEKTVDNVAELRYQLFKHNIGDTVKLTYIRGKDTKTVDIILVANQ